MATGFPMNKEKKIGEVILIPDEFTIVINVGFPIINVGVKISVYEELIDIKNSDGKILGTYDYNKDIVEVVAAFSDYCICRKLESRLTATQIITKSVIQPEIFVKQNLNIEEKYNLNLEPKNKLIILGDPVKKI